MAHILDSNPLTYIIIYFQLTTNIQVDKPVGDIIDLIEDEPNSRKSCKFSFMILTNVVYVGILCSSLIANIFLPLITIINDNAKWSWIDICIYIATFSQQRQQTRNPFVSTTTCLECVRYLYHYDCYYYCVTLITYYYSTHDDVVVVESIGRFSSRIVGHFTTATSNHPNTTANFTYPY